MRCQPETVFVFRLAKELGKTVRELCESLDSRELSQWLAFFKFEDEEREVKKRKETKAKMQGALSGMAKN